MTLEDLAGRLFASVPETASILGADERTVRRAIAAGDIPGRRLGTKYLIPVTWLQEMTGAPASPVHADPGPDLDQLADRVADRVFIRFARLFGQAPNVIAAGPEPPGPAATADDLLPVKKQSRVHRTSAA